MSKLIEDENLIHSRNQALDSVTRNGRVLDNEPTTPVTLALIYLGDVVRLAVDAVLSEWKLRR